MSFVRRFVRFQTVPYQRLQAKWNENQFSCIDPFKLTHFVYISLLAAQNFLVNLSSSAFFNIPQSWYGVLHCPFTTVKTRAATRKPTKVVVISKQLCNYKVVTVKMLPFPLANSLLL